MLNTREQIPRLEIKDIPTLLENQESHISEEHGYEFLSLKSKHGISTDQPHKSNYFGLSIVLSGYCTQLINDHETTLSTDALLFTSPDDVITPKHCANNLEIRQLMFTKSFLLSSDLSRKTLEKLLWVDPEKPPLFRLDKKAFNTTKQLFRNIAEEASLSKPYHKQILRNNIIELLYRMNRLNKPCLNKGNDTSPQKNRLFEEFSDLVDKQFKEKKKVHNYAKQLHVTPKHLSEVVKQESGCTALEYIHRRILREAKNLLTHTNRSAKEIAYDLGYNTPSQFGRFFKRKTGKSPIQFRNSRKTEH
jgi:AraC-like DNA-binding protein